MFKITIDKPRKRIHCQYVICSGKSPQARHSHAAAYSNACKLLLTADKGLFIVGGRDSNDRFLDDIYLLPLENNLVCWTKVNTNGITIPRAMHQVSSLNFRYVATISGFTSWAAIMRTAS